MLEQKILDQIKKELPHGAMVVIKNSAGVSYGAVIKFFKGQSQNPRIANAVVAEYKKHKKTLEALKSCATA